MSKAQPFFLASPQGKGQRFCIFHPADGIQRGRVLHIHPFAEEMNKSRRMAALQARAMAKSGFSVLQIDLFGCGDSSGDFGDAGWQDWLDDLNAATKWLATQGDEPLWLWGHRAGCLLACELLERLDEPVCNLLLWHPPPQGRVLLQQFLRLKLASGLLDGGSGTTMEALKLQLQSQGHVEIAGYALSAGLAAGLEQASLTVASEARTRLGQAHCFEVTSQPAAEPTPALASALTRWRAQGINVIHHPVTGPAFWQTSEIEDAPALLSSTMSTLTAWRAEERVAC
nr:hydrolase 2, exosortase A system-associated [uncultured Roseateles sp.]